MTTAITQMSTALCLLRKICEDLNQEEFTLEEVEQEFGDSDDTFRIDTRKVFKIADLLDLLLENEYVEEVDDVTFRVLQEAPDEDESEFNGLISPDDDGD